ncbi:MAG: type II toxin-antitoxin system HicB family antitoxin [Acidobacteriota bacterium]|nr:type II toxin-antitoxin system HicB family antitoxin [Acidobacteriota bacterium]
MRGGGLKSAGTRNKFAVVVHAEPAGGYWGEVPALPGCYSQGESVEELLANMREAIAGVLDVMREEGRAVEENVQVVELGV